jgi:hypothetical protein
MTRQRNDTYDQFAIPLACPVCAAPRGHGCATKTKRFHNARISAGIRRAVRDDYSQHERAMQAYASVRAAIAAGREPNPREINTSLACACTECLDGMVDQARELLPWL